MAGRLQIEILAGPKVGESFEFDCEAVGMGRSAQCQLQIPSPHVSRKQCELTWQGDQLVLENLGSVNHTYLNDRPIDRAYVQDGDLVTFCDIALRVRIPGLVAAAAAPAPQRVAVPPSVGGGDGATHVVPHSSHIPPSGAQDTYPPGHQPFAPAQPPHQSPAGPHHGFASTGRTAPVPGQVPPGGHQPPPGPQHGVPGQVPSPYPGVPHQAPQQAPHGYPGVSGQPVGFAPGHPPAAQPGYPGQPQGVQHAARPAGMPGMPPGAASLQRGGAQRGSRGGRRKARSSRVGNTQLMRNLVIVSGAVMLLLVIAAAVGTRVLSNRSAGTGAAGTVTASTGKTPASPVEEVKTGVERGDRSNEEILRQAHEDYQRGQVYFREAAVGDENLWESLRYYENAEAELALLDRALWPPFARDIPQKIERAQDQLDKEFKKIKVSFLGYYQSADWRRADQELDLLMRIIPEPEDPRHKWAKRNKSKVKKHLRSMPRQRGPL